MPRTGRTPSIVPNDADQTVFIAQERIEATNGNADDSGASSSSMRPSPTKRASHSH